MQKLPGLLLLFGLALAAAFAAFTVEPAGDQVVDLATGVTTLPDGGRLVDAESGLALEAPFIEYKEGAFVRAKKAKLTTEKVQFFVGVLDYDVKEGRAKLGEGVRFSSPWLKALKAEAGVYYPEDRVAALWTVEAESPRLKAERLIADLKGRLALLLGAFRFEDPKLGVVLRGHGPEARLLLRFDEEGEVSAETEVPKDLYRRLVAFLPQE